jgi:gas vesicle protein
MEDSGKVMLGLLAGVAIGATLGILFAPDKGTETRRKIISKKEDFEDELEERFDAFMEDMKRKFTSLKQEAEEAANAGKEKAAQAGQSYNPA